MPKRASTPHDEGFAQFLASKDTALSTIYISNPSTADTLMRSPYLAMVWWAKQEYDNTPAHRESLRQRLELARADVEEVKRKLVVAEGRPVNPDLSKTPPALKCSKHHDLEDCHEEGSNLCRVCWKFTSLLVKRCSKCNGTVCAGCMDMHEDIGLQMFMSKSNNSVFTTHQHNLKLQKEGRAMFEPEKTLKAINRMREEFYDTEQHRVDLREQVKEAEACLVAAQAEADDAEKRVGK